MSQSSPSSPSSPDYTIAVVARTFDLLEALAVADCPVGITDLARHVGTTKSAAYRILATLEARGYVGKDGATAEYRIGPRLAYLGNRAVYALDVRQHAHPFMESLHRWFGETVNLGVHDGNEVVYLDMIESTRGLRMAAHLGGRDPLHSTALGKAILAFLPEAERTRLLARPLVAQTPRTITDAQVLANELARIREARVAEDRGENEEGARCFGAPIFDHGGAVVAAVSVSAPESRMDDARAAETVGAVREAAAAVTERVGGRVVTPT